MSRDSAGTYSLAPGNPVISGTIIQTAWANPTLSDIATALTDSLSRSGKGGMGAPLVMNGYKITSVGYATQATDVPQATQIRDQKFTVLNLPVDASGNNYVGTALLAVPPTSGTTYLLAAGGSTNTGPMTLAVNGGAALPILINGAPVPPGLVIAATIIFVVYDGFSAYRIIGLSPGGSTVTSVQSTDPALISVVNSAGVATLTPHANVAGGMVKLDGSIKVPVAQLPFQDLFYVGIWNAAPGTNPSTTGINNGDFYVITVAGTLTIYRTSGGNVYTPQATPVVVGDAIILRAGSTDPNQPNGWYFDPAAARPAVASTVSMTPTPTLPAVTDAQAWMTQMDPIIASKLPLAGGTMSGPIVQPALPSAATHLANKQYVDGVTSSLVGVLSFNARTGAVTLTNPDVTGALGYTPLSTAGGTISGNVNITENLNVAKGMSALYFAPHYELRDGITGTVDADFFQGQSQRWNLGGPVVIDRLLNIPQGSILRIAFGNLIAGNTVTWPGILVWPNGITPDLGSGALKLAIVVIESFSGSGGAHLAAATIY